MSGLVFAGIAPHGFSIIGEIAGSEFELFRFIREGMDVFGQRLKNPASNIEMDFGEIFWSRN